MTARKAPLPASLLAVALLLAAPPTADAAAEAPAREWIVAFRAGAPAPPLPAGAEPMEILPGAVVALTDAAARRLAEHPAVLRVDPALPLKRHDLAESGDGKRLIRAGNEARALGVTGRGVTVAVVDSGVDATHPDFEGRVKAALRWGGEEWRDSPVDLDGHGTHVAGIALGSGQASDGRFSGVAPEARLVALDISQSFTTATALRAFNWIYLNREEHGIRVVVNAWGRSDRAAGFDANDPLVKATDRLVDEGVVVVFSVSNRGPGAGDRKSVV
jgi:subtilisin family serine protease